VSITGTAILDEVEKFKADPYVYGAAGPTSFDCSGLIQYALEQLGMTNVPRTSEEQWAWVTHITQSQLQPGDLVFAQFPGDNAPPGHVGVYMGNGEVFSAQDQALGIGAASLASWGSAVYGYGRVPDSSTSGAAGVNAGTSGSSSASSGIGSLLDPLSALASALGTIATDFGDAVSDFDKVAKFFSELTMPSTWIRVGACFAGIGMFIAGFWVLVHKAGNGDGKIRVPIPVPI
jgi:hypothetical protein